MTTYRFHLQGSIKTSEEAATPIFKAECSQYPLRLVQHLYTQKRHEYPTTQQLQSPALTASSTMNLTAVSSPWKGLDGGGRLTPRPGRFTPGKKSRYILYRRLGGPQRRSGWVRKISPHRDSMTGSSSP